MNLDSLIRMYVCMCICPLMSDSILMKPLQIVAAQWKLCELITLRQNIHIKLLRHQKMVIRLFVSHRTYSTVSLYFLGVSLYIPTHMHHYSTLWSLSHVFISVTHACHLKHLKSTIWSVIHVLLSCSVLWAELTVWNLLTRTRTDLTVAGKKIKWVLQQHPVRSYTLGDGMWQVCACACVRVCVRACVRARICMCVHQLGWDCEWHACAQVQSVSFVNP